MDAQGMMVRYTIIRVELFERWGVKLLLVITNKHAEDPEPANNISIHKAFHILFCDRRQRLNLSPLCEVVHRNYYESDLALTYRQRAYDVDSLLGKKTRISYGDLILRWDIARV